MIVVFLADGCFSCFFIWFVGPNALSLSLSLAYSFEGFVSVLVL